MKSILSMTLLISFIMMIMTTILNLVSKKTMADREKSSPFECGFDPKSSSRLPFSLHFFMIAMIFLIFDVEITLLLPFIVTLKNTSLIPYWITLFFFIIILIVGLLHEWKQGALNWN